MNNRKILFRGFHPDEKGDTTITLNGEKIRGEWVYGDRNKTSMGVYIHPQANLFQVDRGCLTKLVVMRQVIPETVGQFVTTDKNGKDVFDKDRVLCAFEDGIFDVYYDDKTLMWVIGNGEIMIDFDHCYNADIELIGNIYDNPELLEGKNENPL